VNDTHDEPGGDADPYDWDPVYAAATIAELQKQLAAALARAESATVLPERWRALIAERDAAVKQAQEAEVRLTELGKPTEWGQPRTEWTWSARKPDGAAVPPMFPDPHPPRTEESVRREFNGVVDNMGYQKVLLCRDVTAWRDANAMHSTNVDDGSGWTAEENAEFEQRYGVKAAMYLRAANDRVWRIVQELRQAAVDEGRDPYQDPMARRLSAALVGAEKVCSALPESLSGPQTCCTRHVHDGLMHICALAAGHDTHMCAEGDRWTTNDDATEDDRG